MTYNVSLTVTRIFYKIYPKLLPQHLFHWANAAEIFLLDPEGWQVWSNTTRWPAERSSPDPWFGTHSWSFVFYSSAHGSKHSQESRGTAQLSDRQHGKATLLISQQLCK